MDQCVFFLVCTRTKLIYDLYVQLPVDPYKDKKNIQGQKNHIRTKNPYKDKIIYYDFEWDDVTVISRWIQSYHNMIFDLIFVLDSRIHRC